MAKHGPRHAAGRRPLVAVLLPPVLAVVLVLTVALGLALGGALRASGDAPEPSVALAGGATDPPADAAAAPSGEASPAPDDAAAPPDAPAAADGSGADVPAAPDPPAAASDLPAAVPGELADEEADEATRAERADSALAAVTEAAARAGGVVHVVVVGPDGEQELADPGARDQTYTASLVKLLVVQQLFAREAAGQLPLSEGDLRLMERAVRDSDDGAMSALWGRFDGAALLTAAAAEFGLAGTALPDVPGQWGEARTTAADMAVFLSSLDAHLPADDVATLTGWMRAPAASATDGFGQEWGLLSPAVRADGQAGAKQGWMCCVDGRRQLHSAGVLGDGRTVVLLGEFPTSTGWARAQEALDAAATAVVNGTAS